MTPERLESFAIRVALGNNGGAWATHYTEAQKEHWRQFVRDLADEIWSSMVPTLALREVVIKTLDAVDAIDDGEDPFEGETKEHIARDLANMPALSGLDPAHLVPFVEEWLEDRRTA